MEGNFGWTAGFNGGHSGIVKRGRRIPLWLLLALMAGGAGYWVKRPKEPEYLGKKLSYWVDHLDSKKAGAALEAAIAFEDMGTNAVPHLIRMLDGKRSWPHRKLIALAENLPASWRANVIPGLNRDHNAAWALANLGERSAAAIPALIEKQGDYQNDPEGRYVYGVTLGMIGPASALPLGNVLASRDAFERELVFSTLEHMGTNASAAVPGVLQYCKSAGVDKAVGMRLLGVLGGPADTVLPYLMTSLDDKSAPVRMAAAHSLGEIGADAREAVPKLKQMTMDADPEISEAANRALAGIAREPGTEYWPMGAFDGFRGGNRPRQKAPAEQKPND